jgi:transaldolase/glucose-6-phosphate isomerase
MTKSDNPLVMLQGFGQSVWLDFLRRGMLDSGELATLIADDGLSGVTSNPSIFEKAIDGSPDYDDAIASLSRAGADDRAIYEKLVVEDVQRAADLFRPVHERTRGADGFVSLEVNPHLARNTQASIEEARRLWRALDRPNVLIKVPGTREGLPAIRQLIREGINVNVTLLFGLPRYREVADAYLAGLEARASDGNSVEHVASVASFFLSRIDVLVDQLLERSAGEGATGDEPAADLRGQVAVASAKVAYSLYGEIFGGERFRRLAAQGARPQRVLWASTSTKNPQYSDVKYVEALIGPHTINTMPLETLNAFRDHGDPAPRLEPGLDEARRVLDRLATAGIDIDQVTHRLVDEGIEKFCAPFDALMETLGARREADLTTRADRQTMALGDEAPSVRQRLEDLQRIDFCERLWRKDAALWSKDAREADAVRGSLGWLHAPERMEVDIDGLLRFAAEMSGEGFQQVVHMGMGGSSLAPLVFQRVLPASPNGLPLTVLDSTDPATVLGIEQRVPLERTLFLVASKSGTTAEPLAFADYFHARLEAVVGNKAGRNFAAITDAGTPLVALARRRGYRAVFLNLPGIGGRYSALSYFGLVPAALMGGDIGGLLDRALRMSHACAACVPPEDNPGLHLGAALGELARRGRDKVTFLAAPPLAPLAMWLEQLLAESTGKHGTGLLPVAGEPPGDPDVYGTDRVFVRMHLNGQGPDMPAETVAALRGAGHPVIDLRLADALDLGQEMLRWEVAVATAGTILGINPFDQPNVQESKDNTNHLLQRVEAGGPLPEEDPALTDGPLRFFGTAAAPDGAATLARFLDQCRPGDYVALLAFLTESPAADSVLQAIRVRLRDALRVATTLGYGPRYLHSTGQMHKGGPDTGLFLQVTADDPIDDEIPQRPYGFSVLKRAQALGDLEALRRHGRRVLRVHLAGDQVSGLKALQRAVAGALNVMRAAAPSASG